MSKWSRFKKFCVISISVLSAYILLVVLIDIFGPESEDTQQAHLPTPIVSSTLSSSAKPIPTAAPVTREWTATELAECDTSTLKKQVEASESTEELLSDCEVAWFLAQMDTTATVSEMPAQDRSLFTEQTEILESISQAIDKVYADKVIDRDEFVLMCSVAPQWIDHIQGVRHYIESMGRSGLKGLEIDVIRNDRVVSKIYDACIQGDLLLADPTIPSDSSTPDASVPEDPSATEDELFRELQKDPCFRGRVPSVFGQGWTYLWDTECQMSN